MKEHPHSAHADPRRRNPRTASQGLGHSRGRASHLQSRKIPGCGCHHQRRRRAGEVRRHLAESRHSASHTTRPHTPNLVVHRSTALTTKPPVGFLRCVWRRPRLSCTAVEALTCTVHRKPEVSLITTFQTNEQAAAMPRKPCEWEGCSKGAASGDTPYCIAHGGASAARRRAAPSQLLAGRTFARHTVGEGDASTWAAPRLQPVVVRRTVRRMEEASAVRSSSASYSSIERGVCTAGHVYRPRRPTTRSKPHQDSPARLRRKPRAITTSCCKGSGGLVDEQSKAASR